MHKSFFFWFKKKKVLGLEPSSSSTQREDILGSTKNSCTSNAVSQNIIYEAKKIRIK